MIANMPSSTLHQVRGEIFYVCDRLVEQNKKVRCKNIPDNMTGISKRNVALLRVRDLKSDGEIIDCDFVTQDKVKDMQQTMRSKVVNVLGANVGLITYIDLNGNYVYPVDLSVSDSYVGSKVIPLEDYNYLGNYEGEVFDLYQEERSSLGKGCLLKISGNLIERVKHAVGTPVTPMRLLTRDEITTPIMGMITSDFANVVAIPEETLKCYGGDILMGDICLVK